MTEEDFLAFLDLVAEAGEPGDPELCPDPEDGAPPPGEDELTAADLAECREITGEQASAAEHAAALGTAGALAAAAASLGRRGPDQPGSTRSFPGEYPGPAAGFATGMPLDTSPGCPELALFVGDAAGDDDAYAGVSDDELLGAICAWDRVEAHAAARKHAALAEYLRRRPAPGCVPEGPARMPARWDEFAADELSCVLAESRWAAENMLELAHDLQVKLPGTDAAFRAGILRESKAAIIARACELLDAAEARAAEDLVLDRAGRLTPAGLRSAIARAVMQVAPDKARKRREHSARDARVERWAEDSGNSALAGRELPPAAVLAADQRVTAWAKELKKAGLAGSMDELRARAYLDLLLGVDSRPAPASPSAPARGRAADPRPDPRPDAPDAPDASHAHASHAPDGPHAPDAPDGPPGAVPPGAGPLAGMVPAGFAARLNLTVPLQNITEMAARPGELSGTGPVDPWLARDLAAAAARHPRTTWCVTVTDAQGHAIGHGCARPQRPKRPQQPQPRIKRKRPRQDPRDGPSPDTGNTVSTVSTANTGSTGSTENTVSTGLALTATGQPGPPGGFGTWRLSTGIPGQPDLVVALEPVAIGDCDHRHETKGHDPGITLRHLTQIRHATCTAPGCRRPAAQCDFDHSVPYEAGGRTCACNGGPKCRHHHRVKQDPRWTVGQPTPGTFRWTTPSGRSYVTEPTRYPE